MGQASKFRSHQVVHCNGKVTARAQTASSDGPHEGPALGAVLLAEGPVTALPALVDGHGAFAPLGRYGHRGRGRHVATAPSSLAAPVAAVALRPEGEKAVPQTGQARAVTPSLRDEGSARPGAAWPGAAVTPSLRDGGSTAWPGAAWTVTPSLRDRGPIVGPSSRGTWRAGPCAAVVTPSLRDGGSVAWPGAAWAVRAARKTTWL